MAPTTIATAARLMLERHLRWMLPVRDAAGRVPGVISRSDVLATFLRDDASAPTSPTIFPTRQIPNSRMRLSRAAQTAAGHLTPADASVT